MKTSEERVSSILKKYEQRQNEVNSMQKEVLNTKQELNRNPKLENIQGMTPYFRSNRSFQAEESTLGKKEKRRPLLRAVGSLVGVAAAAFIIISMSTSVNEHPQVDFHTGETAAVQPNMSPEQAIDGQEGTRDISKNQDERKGQGEIEAGYRLLEKKENQTRIENRMVTVFEEDWENVQGYGQIIEIYYSSEKEVIGPGRADGDLLSVIQVRTTSVKLYQEGDRKKGYFEYGNNYYAVEIGNLTENELETFLKGYLSE